MTATPSDRDILYDIVTNGRWSEGEQRGEWMITKEVYETARDALASRSLEREAEWLPIGTAPKDGTRVLLFPHYVVAHWEFGDDEWVVTEVPLEPDGRIAVDWTVPPKCWYCLYANVGGHEPTHWMPLPCALAQQPPAGETK